MSILSDNGALPPFYYGVARTRNERTERFIIRYEV